MLQLDDYHVITHYRRNNKSAIYMCGFKLAAVVAELDTVAVAMTQDSLFTSSACDYVLFVFSLSVGARGRSVSVSSSPLG